MSWQSDLRQKGWVFQQLVNRLPCLQHQPRIWLASERSAEHHGRLVGIRQAATVGVKGPERQTAKGGGGSAAAS